MVVRGSVECQNSFFTAMMASVMSRELEYLVRTNLIAYIFPERWQMVRSKALIILAAYHVILLAVEYALIMLVSSIEMEGF